MKSKSLLIKLVGSFLLSAAAFSMSAIAINNSKNKENFIEKLNNYSKDCIIDTFVRINDSKLWKEIFVKKESGLW